MGWMKWTGTFSDFPTFAENDEIDQTFQALEKQLFETAPDYSVKKIKAKLVLI